MSDSWRIIDPNLHVHNTFLHVGHVEGSSDCASKSDPEPSSRRRDASPDSSVVRQRPVKITDAFAAESDSATAPEPHRGARPGRKERMRMKDAAGWLGLKGYARRLLNHCIHASCALWRSVQRTMKATMPIWCALLVSLVVVACALASGFLFPRRPEVVSPAKHMMVHSEVLLNRSTGADIASISALQDKLQFKKMNIDLITDTFTGTRAAAKAFVQSECALPERMCSTMVAAIDAREMKYHKKGSVPLDENEGSYNAVWLWVQQTAHEDEVQVAFKGASMSYKLRDVIEYRDQVDEEPVIKCESSTSSGFFTSETKENCKEVSKKKTVTPIPVFKTTIMSPQEMDLVDTLMETMVAKKALENTSPAALGSSPTPQME